MGLFSWFTTSEKAVDTGLDLVKDAAAGIDMLWFTDEEKAIASLKVMESVIKFQEAQKDENSVRAKVRRALALLIIGNYLLLINIGAGCGLVGDKVRAEYIFNLANETLGTAVVSVIIFYFGYFGISQILNRVKK